MPRSLSLPVSILVLTLALPAAAEPPAPAADPLAGGHHEVPDDPYVYVPRGALPQAPARIWRLGSHASVQVNVAAGGANILGDAANEPSIAVDPTNPARMVIGWRQFDTVASSFRQAGWAFTTDGGASWTFPGVIEPGIFRSDPVLDVEADGTFHYYSLRVPNNDFLCDDFASTDGGASWGSGVFAFGGDKAWFSIDRTGGSGHGHLYAAWSPGVGCCGNDRYNRSVDGGASFESPVPIPDQPVWGVTAVAPDGTVYVGGRRSNGSDFVLASSSSSQDAGSTPAFESVVAVDLGGEQRVSTGPNPSGLLGQVWVGFGAGAHAGELYMLASVDPPGADPLDVHFVRSLDDGATWSSPLRVNDDPGTAAWQWFGTMSVAPNGRIDVVWNDSRDDPGGFDSALYYGRSYDGGVSWSASEPLSPVFDPHLGWPQQNKLGDYYDMVSDHRGAHLAYAATFNGEQDVYYLRVTPTPFFADGFESGGTAAWALTSP